MGWSCSTKASFTLEALGSLSEFDTDSKDYKYFIEIGRENDDGSITGGIFELIGEAFPGDKLNRRPCRFKGNFKINKHGEIERMPGLPKRFWPIVHIHSIETYDREIMRPRSMAGAV